MKRRTVGLAAIMATTAFVASALVFGPGRPGAAHEPPRSDPEASLSSAISHLAARHDAIDGVWLEQSLREALPNVSFAIDGAAPRPAYDRVITGRVVTVEMGSGFRDEVTPDGATTETVDFGAADASWRSIELTIEVDDDLDPDHPPPEAVRVVLPFGPSADVDAMLTAFEGRRVLAVLEAPGAFVPDPTLRIAGRSGALLGLIDETGRLTMPFLGEVEEAYLDGLTTIDEVMAEASGPASVIVVTSDGGYRRS